MARFTRQQVANAAINIAAEHGLGAATMRRIGAELGVEAMSLYTYVESRSDLEQAMCEQLLPEDEAEQLDKATSPLDCRPDIAAAARRWVLAVAIGRLHDDIGADLMDAVTEATS